MNLQSDPFIEALLDRIHTLEQRVLREQELKRQARRSRDNWKRRARAAEPLARSCPQLRAQIRELMPLAEMQRRWESNLAHLNAKRKVAA